MSSGLGDPARMRAEAASLRTRASRLGEVAAGLDAEVSRMEFEGPAAVSFRLVMAGRRRRAESLAHELQALASSVDRAAERAERELAVRSR